MKGIDWAGLLRAGLGRLHLHPDAFWRLTPVELALLLGLEGATPPLTRSRLESLAAAFPDHRKDAADG